MVTRWSRTRGESYLRRKMEWRWGRGRGETHDGAVVQRNRAMALGFGWNLLGGARCSGRRARGGRRKEKQMARRVCSGRRGAASRRGCDGGMRTARGQRAQASGDARHTRVIAFLNRSAMFTEGFLKTRFRVHPVRLTAKLVANRSLNPW